MLNWKCCHAYHNCSVTCHRGFIDELEVEDDWMSRTWLNTEGSRCYSFIYPVWIVPPTNEINYRMTALSGLSGCFCTVIKCNDDSFRQSPSLMNSSLLQYLWGCWDLLGGGPLYMHCISLPLFLPGSFDHRRSIFQVEEDMLDDSYFRLKLE